MPGCESYGRSAPIIGLMAANRWSGSARARRLETLPSRNSASAQPSSFRNRRANAPNVTGPLEMGNTAVCLSCIPFPLPASCGRGLPPKSWDGSDHHHEHRTRLVAKSGLRRRFKYRHVSVTLIVSPLTRRRRSARGGSCRGHWLCCPLQLLPILHRGRLASDPRGTCLRSWRRSAVNRKGSGGTDRTSQRLPVTLPEQLDLMLAQIGCADDELVPSWSTGRQGPP